MQLRTLLSGFLTSVLYPMWLVAGAGDYLCHRRTHIEQTSGITESWLHVAQFASIAIIFVAAVLLEVTLAVLIAMIAALIAHTVLSFIDVSYTMRHRHISTLEQHVHGVLDVVPIVAVGLLAILYWEEIALADGAPLRLKDEPLSSVQAGVLLGSFGVLAGVPIFEEWFRARRSENIST
jgi:hypothetical protein